MSYREPPFNWIEFVFRLALLVPVAALLVVAVWAAECRQRPKRDPEPPAKKTPATGRKPWVTITWEVTP